MNTTNRLWHVAAALGLGLLADVLTPFYVTNYKRHVRAGESKVTVFVAPKDIPADTPGTDILSKHLLAHQPIARGAPRKSAASGTGPGGDACVQLAVTDSQSQKLQWLAVNAPWRLELRPAAGSADSPGTLDPAGTVTAAGLRRGTNLNSLLSTP